jgi:formate-dependent nitrite reductase cytochrome c552 subunit
LSTVETPLPDGDKTEKNVTKTTRIIDAIDEFRAVDSDRTRLRNKILDICSNTCIGWLCPRKREGDLRKRVAAVQAEIRIINNGTTHYTLTDGCVIATIETDAEVAAKTIRDTLKDALESLREAFQEGDYEGMRAIVRGLKGFDALVNDEAAEKVGEAIAEARRIANTISREVVRKARKLEDVQAELSLEAIDTARFMLMAQEGEVRESEEEPLPEVDRRDIEVGGESNSETPAADGDDAGAVA